MRFIALRLHPNGILPEFHKIGDTSLCYNSERFLHQKILNDFRNFVGLMIILVHLLERSYNLTFFSFDGK